MANENVIPTEKVQIPVAWLHILHMDGGQKLKRLTERKHDYSFGKRGVDYSPEYFVTSEPLFRSKK